MEENRQVNLKWYIIQVVTGYEQKVKDDLENRDFDKTDIGEIFLPMKVLINKSGAMRKKPMYPGYLYVNVDMTDDNWFIIRNTNYVTGIVGSSGQRTKPTPISNDQISKIKNMVIDEELKIQNIASNSKKESSSVITNVDFKNGDTVKVIQGEFAEQVGKVSNISIETQRAVIEIELFGRLTEAEIDLNLLSKVKKLD